MTSVEVLIPWRAGCPHRERALEWVMARYRAAHPDWSVILGASPEGPFSRSAAILDAYRRSSADVFVVADSDVWCDPAAAVGEAAEWGWAIPHQLVHRLSPPSTELVLAGGDWHGLPLSTDNPQDSSPYVGHATGTLVVLSRGAMLEAPPDPRFVGWGQEDDAWSAALRTIVGPPWRGTGDLVHLWHPAQPRQTRRIGSPAGLALAQRYRRALSNPDAMRRLIAEGRAHGHVHDLAEATQ